MGYLKQDRQVVPVFIPNRDETGTSIPIGDGIVWSPTTDTTYSIDNGPQNCPLKAGHIRGFPPDGITLTLSPSTQIEIMDGE